MFTNRARRGPRPLVAARNAGARLRRSVAMLAALSVGLLVSAATVPAAFAVVPDPGGAAAPPASRRYPRTASAWSSQVAWRPGRSP